MQYPLSHVCGLNGFSMNQKSPKDAVSPFVGQTRYIVAGHGLNERIICRVPPPSWTHRDTAASQSRNFLTAKSGGILRAFLSNMGSAVHLGHFDCGTVMLQYPSHNQRVCESHRQRAKAAALKIPTIPTEKFTQNLFATCHCDSRQTRVMHYL
jgi:hypothetical protein